MRGGTRSGKAGRGVYARRRLLVVLAVLLVLALLIPRACQALFGSDEDAGQGRDQRSGAAGTAAGAGAEDEAGDAGTSDAGTGNAGTGNAGTGNADAEKSGTQDETFSRGAPFVEDGSAAEGSEEAAPDLGAMVANLAVIDGDEDLAASEDQSAGGSDPSPSGTRGEPRADEQPISELQFALAASQAPPQPSSEAEPAPSRRSRLVAAAPVAEPAATPLRDRVRDRAGRLARAALAEPAALDGVGARQAVVERVAAEPTPAAAVASDPTFAPTPAGRALSAASAIRTTGVAPAALPAGPRLAGLGPAGTPGPTGTPGPAVF